MEGDGSVSCCLLLSMSTVLRAGQTINRTSSCHQELTVNAGKESPEGSVVTTKNAPGRVGPTLGPGWESYLGSLEDITPVA